MRKLDGKIAVITGAARGNGEGTARVMARKGATVVLVDLLPEVHNTATSIATGGFKAFSFQVDISKASEVNGMVGELMERFGRVDILVNNAGVIHLVPLVDLSDEVRDRMFDINIKGTFICTKAVLSAMIERHYGKIVNISSVTGTKVADEGETAYAATKAAIWGFTKALAVEVAPHGINVNAVCPGMIGTDMIRQMATETNPEDPDSVIERMAKGIPMARLGKTEELGKLVAFLASDDSRYITGTSIVIDGGSTLPESRVMGAA
ncbi:MAG: glucose 1-dehydrogenase [Dehalococcoidales bacterium]